MSSFKLDEAILRYAPEEKQAELRNRCNAINRELFDISEKFNKLKVDLHNQSISEIFSQCPICHDTIHVLVELKNPVYGGVDCHCGTAGKFICLPCARNWFELNKPKHERKESNKHFYCQKTFSNRDLNVSIYEVRRDLMELIDVSCPIEIIHSCGKKFSSRIDLHNHMKDATCPDSYRGCPKCKGSFKLLPDFILHVERCFKHY